MLRSECAPPNSMYGNPHLKVAIPRAESLSGEGGGLMSEKCVLLNGVSAGLTFCCHMRLLQNGCCPGVRTKIHGCCWHIVLNIQHPKLQETNICHLQLPSLLWFVIATPKGQDALCICYPDSLLLRLSRLVI